MLWIFPVILALDEFFVGMLCLWRLMVSSSENWSPLSIPKPQALQVTGGKGLQPSPAEAAQLIPLMTPFLAWLTVRAICHHWIPPRDWQPLISRINPEPTTGHTKAWKWCNCASESGLKREYGSIGENGVFFPNYSDDSSWVMNPANTPGYLQSFNYDWNAVFLVLFGNVMQWNKMKEMQDYITHKLNL